jgi:Uma2 family endonuclease
LVEDWLSTKLRQFSEEHPAVINFISGKARVFVPRRQGPTAPEPDQTAYQDFPFHLPRRQLRWQDVSPLLVAEILSGDPDKDLVRNVELYREVPSIKEYWVIDTREDPDHPTLRVYRRSGKRWRIIDLAFGETYTTRLLPGFSLVVDPRR